MSSTRLWSPGRRHVPLPIQATEFFLRPPPLALPDLRWFPPGLSDDLIQKGKDIKGVSEIVQNGKHFKFTITTGSKVIQNEFTLGEECELESMTGEKVKVRVPPRATLCFQNFPGNLAPGLLPQGSSLTVPTADTLPLNPLLESEAKRQRCF